jgi:hypothetical protein
MSKNKNVTIYNVIDIVNEVGFHKLNDAAKDAFMMILSKTKKGSVLINRPYHSSDFDSLHIYLERINDYLIRQKLVKDFNTPLITVKSKISLKEILELIDQINIYQLDSTLMLNCLILTNSKVVKSISEILRDEDLIPIVESVQMDFTSLNKIFGGLPKKSSDITLLGFTEKFTKWLSQKNQINNHKKVDHLGDINLKKKQNNSGFQFREDVIHPLRIMNVIADIGIENSPFSPLYIHDLLNRIPDNDNKLNKLLDSPSAKVLIDVFCEFITGNVNEDIDGEPLETIKIVTGFNGTPSIFDKIDLLLMLDPMDYNNMYSIAIKSIQILFTETPIADFGEIPENLEKEINGLYGMLITKMNYFGGLPTGKNLEKSDDLYGIRKGINAPRSKSVAEKFIAIYNSLAQATLPSREEVQDLLEEIQSLIVNLKIRKTDPAADLIDEVQKNLIHFLQGKIKTLKSVSKQKLDGFLFGIEPINNKCEVDADCSNTDLKLIAKKDKSNEKKKKSSKSENGLSGWIRETDQLKTNQEEQIKPVMTVQEAAELPVIEIPFSGLLHQLFGRPEMGFTAMMYGAPGCGKSTLALWMAKQFALHHGKVLYVSPEQYPKGSLTTLINRMGMSDIAGIDLTKQLSNANPDRYDFIFIDSVNSHKLRIEDFISLKNQHPHKTFILILQSTKDKTYRGSRDWEHEVDNVIYIEPSKAEVTKTRFLLPGKTEVEIPDLIGDQNPKSTFEQSPQPTV